jgi:outer membrane protein OmpA-like peptidoglycan-associated protein
MKYLFFTLSLFFVLISKSQDSSAALKAGDTCPSLVVNTAENSIQSFIFPHSKKITLIHFWSSTNPESMKDFYRFSLIYKKYGNEEYKSGDGFDMILVALQSDKKAWISDIEKYNLKDVNNGICLKGFNDFYIKYFKLTETPTSLLVDENGKIIAVNPDVTSLVNYLDERRDYVGDNKAVTKIDGKIFFGNGSIAPLANEKIYLINDKKDTVQVTSTNENGKFSLNNPNIEGLTINIHKSSKIGEDDNVLLATEKGTVVSAFKKMTNEFEYKLLDLEVSFLKPIAEPEVKLKSAIKDLNFSENLYEDGGFALSAKSKSRLDGLLLKLKNYPGATVEIISHSDCRGNSDANAALSLKRSTSIANYFASKGIAREKIKAIGKGEEEPVNRCVDGVACSEAELAENRRTEFRFYKSE